LFEGHAHVVQTYRLSLLAPWPTEMSQTRTTLETTLLVTIPKLARLVPSNANGWSATSAPIIRSALDREISRLHRLTVLLDGIAPPAAAIPVPVPAAAPPAPPAPPAPVPAPAPAPAPTPPSSTIETLPSGQGFAGATSQPATVGTGAGSNCMAIARWDVVPMQTVSSPMPIGVVAFHINGIDRVEFSLNGGT